jgi:hypothetical protein
MITATLLTNNYFSTNKTVQTMRSQTTSNILMIRPVRFGFNEQTAESNAFQDKAFGQQTQETAQTQALQEFDEMVARLRKHGVNVIVVDDTPEPHTPDSIFRTTGFLSIITVQSSNIRCRLPTVVWRDAKISLVYWKKIFISIEELTFRILKKKASFWRVLALWYLTVSLRLPTLVFHHAHESVLNEFGIQMNYEIVKFTAVDGAGKQIYHTNVLMCIGDMFAVICLEAIPDLDERLNVRNSLESSGKQVIEITLDQMNQFAGNMLEIRSEKGDRYLVMSDAAYYSLTQAQTKILGDYCTILHFDLSMIEGNGGGSARCMMAEVHLPMK